MPVTINGTTGIAGVDGSAGTPAVQGADSNTGIFFPAADTIAFAEGGAEVMRIDSSGNLGIGTSSPNERMTITSSTAGSYLQICDSSTGTTSGDGLFLGSFNGAAELKTKENKELQFGTNNTERARIDSSGNLLVNRTSQLYNGKVSITNDTNNAGYEALINGSGWGVIINNTNAGGQNFAQWRYNGSVIGTITGNNSNTTYATSSDYRLKDNIQPMSGALVKVSLLKPCTYTWKVDGKPGEGFIAHELAEVVPDAVVGEKDAVDADGNPVYQGIDTSFLVATLTAAIQEQQALIESLTARIAALEAA